MTGPQLPHGPIPVLTQPMIRLGDPFDRVRGDVAPERGWVAPGDLVWCDACGKRCWYWELHHLDPVGWGGPDSRQLVDRQVVWVRVDSDCHAVAHMILDTARRGGAWPEAWLLELEIPHPYVELARRGWQLYQRRLREAA